MKPGDLIVKMSGMDRDKKGLILKIVNGARSVKIVTALVDGKIKNWPAHLVEVVNEVGS